MTDFRRQRSRTHEHRWALLGNSHLFAAAFVFSIFVNLLMLAGPLYMLQVYDRVLTSRSTETLTALTVLIAALFVLLGLLDFVRGRVMARVGARLFERLSKRVDQIALSDFETAVGNNERLVMLRRAAPQNLANVQQALSGSAPFVFFDMPWVPVFLGLLFVFHPLIGVTALAGGLVMLALSLANQANARQPLRDAQGDEADAALFGETLRRDREVLQALGMRSAAIDRLGRTRASALHHRMVASDRAGFYSSASRATRFFLQSAILGVGALLVIQQEITAGLMIASSILLGRALAPLEQGISQWSTITRGLASWREVRDVLRSSPEPVRAMRLPQPSALLEVRDLSIHVPRNAAHGEQKILDTIDFKLLPGEAMGVIGHSASGKSTLARVLAGILPPTDGEVRLDGATLDQWHPDMLGKYLGYLPQDVSLLPGTVAENIARFDPNMTSDAVIHAATLAGAHMTVLGLPSGYDTQLDVFGDGGGVRLSGGQRQRLGLARAIYGIPSLMILDEPNAHLDAEGERALVAAIEQLKALECTVVVMAHRPSAIAVCEKLLVLEGGRQRAFGTREAVLREHVRANTRVVTPQVVRAALSKLEA